MHFEIAHDKLAEVKASFATYLGVLRDCLVPTADFGPLVRAVLKIRKPKEIKPDSRQGKNWQALDTHLAELCTRYTSELGGNAYAVFNAVTEFASHPPAISCVLASPQFPTHGRHVAKCFQPGLPEARFFAAEVHRKADQAQRRLESGESQRPTMTPTQFAPTKAEYPAALKTRLGDRQLPRVTALGNLDHLNTRLLALLCSAKCPGNLILDTYDLARSLRNAGVATIGGFHSPMEKECLDLLLRGKQPVVICPARGIQRMRTPSAWKPALDDGRLLVLSPFREADRRMTAALAVRRNEFVAAIADEIFVAYAAPGSKTEQFCRDVIAEGSPVFVFGRKENQMLLEFGAHPFDLSEYLRGKARQEDRRYLRVRLEKNHGSPDPKRSQ